MLELNQLMVAEHLAFGGHPDSASYFPLATYFGKSRRETGFTGLLAEGQNTFSKPGQSSHAW